MRKYIIVDLDGTLLHPLQYDTLTEFNIKVKRNESQVDLEFFNYFMNLLSNIPIRTQLVFCTARCESLFYETYDLLCKSFKHMNFALFMRKRYDFRDSKSVKLDLLLEKDIMPHEVMYWFEDLENNEIGLQEIRELGFNVIHPQEFKDKSFAGEFK